MAGISKLSDDVLRTIFDLNAHRYTHPYPGNIPVIRINLEPDDGMLTTLRTSHVCQSWRTILLTSPAIWALLIDLTELCVRPSLRDLVVGRASSAPMWVRGADLVSITSVYGVTSHTKSKILLPFLDAHWSQIRKLDLALFMEDSADSLRDIIAQEAPLLEHFKIDHQSLSTSHIRSNATLLFDGKAPLLRRFDCSLYTLDFNANWLSHLQHLTFFASDKFPPIQLSSFLRTLGSMSELRSLRLTLLNVVDGRVAAAPSIGAPSSISLPQLKSLDFHGSVSACTAFIEAASPLPATCVPWMTIHDLREELSSSAASTITNHFLAFANINSSYSEQQVWKLLIIYSRDRLQFSAGRLADREAIDQEDLFTIAFANPSRASTWFDTIPVLPDSFCNLITHLNLIGIDRITGAPETVQLKMAQILSVFTSVTHLHSSPQTGRFLNRYVKDQGLFPALQLVIEDQNGYFTNGWVKKFRRLRREMNYPPFQHEIDDD